MVIEHYLMEIAMRVKFSETSRHILISKNQALQVIYHVSLLLILQYNKIIVNTHLNKELNGTGLSR